MNQEVEEHVRSPSGAGELKGWEGGGRSEAGGGRAEAERESREPMLVLRPQGCAPRGPGDPRATSGFTPRSKGSEPGTAPRAPEAQQGQVEV